jgi:DUF1365 family protein
VDPSRVLATFEFEHPLFDTAAVAMQKRIPEIQGVDRIWYAGAWQRYGFHEDGLWSAVRVAEGLGIRTPWADELDAGAEHVLEPAAAESEPGRVRTRVTEPEPDQPMASLATTSALYVGTVAHTRTRPKRNEFSYGIYFVYVDIDRLDELAGELVTFAHNGPGTVAVNDAEHGPRDGSPLRPWFDSVLARAGVDLGPGGRVMLLTFPRVGRWRFYPASFWYAFAGDGTLRAIMAEVNNTYGEHHDYLMHASGAAMAWTDKPEVDKVFHVSPFIEMDARYTFSFTEPGEELGVRILDTVAGKPLLLAKIELQRRPLTDEAVRPVIREYGPMSRRAAMLIGLQAARLVGKGIAFIPKPAPPAEDVTL